MAWLVGDNGLRNPRRMRDGIEVLVNSEFHGDLSRQNEEAIALLLEREGIVSLQNNQDNTIARKWKRGPIRLGFIHPDTHIVTENGRRLIHTNSLPEQEDCFLRSLLVHQLPSTLHPLPGADINNPFSPLRMVLEILSYLESVGEEALISKNETASIVMYHYDMNEIPVIVEEIIDYRRQRREAAGNVRRFEREYREHAVVRSGDRVGAGSVTSYADVNFRYLKLTGLFAEEGISRLSVAVQKRTIVEQILATPYQPIPEDEYIDAIGRGASLPTDNEDEAITVIRDLHLVLTQQGANPESLPLDLHLMSVEDLGLLRIRLENQWLHYQERQYALRQRNEWEDISGFLRVLQRPYQRGNVPAIPQGEAPVYMEWAIWRAFLAINSLQNEPWESRRFTVDRTFMPLRHAPSGDADMIFEFENFVFVVEVTLTSSSRQEAAEGEPVRRHVAQHVDRYAEIGKRVFGVFIADNIDTNTAETFRIGVWYRGDDTQMSVPIVPITLSDFARIFEALFRNNHMDGMDEYLRQLVVELRSFSLERAPDWKRLIEEEVERRVQTLSSPTE